LLLVMDVPKGTSALVPAVVMRRSTSMWALRGSAVLAERTSYSRQ
jgi:hypothetical protein